MMKIKWLGHASFYIETSDVKIITDPFEDRLGYNTIKPWVDIVTVSHDHWDHNAVHLLPGHPAVISEPGEFNLNGVLIQGIPVFHDKHQGKFRGNNIIFKMTVAEIKILHLGDIGALLTREQYEMIGDVDILMIPVGGNYTIDADEAYEIMLNLKPGITLPMHYLTSAINLDIAPVEGFIARLPKVIKKPHLEINCRSLPQENQIVLLDYTD